MEEKRELVKGYKVFNPDWTCREKQYACPGKFEEDVELNVCKAGMHFCKKAADCFKYYEFDPKNHIAEIIAYGNIEENDDKCCTDKLEIVREIPWAELLEIANTGKGCTGLNNTGNRNTGDRNTGYWNTGNRNTGNCNTGDRNTGNRNTGNRNTGDWNTGDRNTGDWNTGDWNKTNHSSGCFNTTKQKIDLFNKPSDWTYRDWCNSEAHDILSQMPKNDVKWISSDDMTDEEKTAHPEHETTGGFLRKIPAADRQSWWDSLSENGKAKVKSIPNFDAEIFKKITGIEV